MQRIHRLLSISAMLALSLSACDSNDGPDKDSPADKVSQAAYKTEDATKQAAKEAEQAAKEAEQAAKKAEQDAKKAEQAVDEDVDGLEDRFELIDRESQEAFVPRAKAEIAKLELELAAAKAKGAKDTAAVQADIDEANRDLTELETGAKVFDDGKLGVTVAINSARRKLMRLENT